jgi:predicted membrane protein
MSKSHEGHEAWNRGLKISEVRPDIVEKFKENHADMSGDKNPFFGKTHSEETKKKLSELNIKHQIGDVWTDSRGVKKYKDKSGKNRRLPTKKLPKL